MPKVAIVIVNWNSGLQIRDCVESIDQHGEGLGISTVVVDNGSTDGSADSVASLSGVKVVRSGSNLGFARACNLGASFISDADYLLFLNPDAMLAAGVLQRAVEFMEAPSSSTIGICGVALLEESGRVARSCARFPTPLRLALIATGIDRIFPSFGTTMTEWDHAQSQIVDQVIGAFFLVRRALFVHLKGFDERFFVYFEEVDFAFRARHYGAKSIFLADVKAFHRGGGTSGQVKPARLFYSLRSRILYARKHFSRMGYLLVVATTFGLEPVSRSVNHLVRGQFVGVRETLFAYRMLFEWAVGVEK